MMQKISLNVGNTWDWKFLNELIRLNKEVSPISNIYVTSIYGSLSWLTASARSSDRLPLFPFKERTDEENGLHAYINKAQSNGIAIRYTLNQSCIGSMSEFSETWKTLKQAVHHLHDNLCIRQFTVTSPLITELLVQEFADVFIEVSTICEVDDPEKLRRWMKLGALGVCLKLDANRDGIKLEEMSKACKKYNMRLELLANEFCIFRCPFRQECYNLSSHNSSRGPFNHYPYGHCQNMRIKSIDEWVRARFILPQWMRQYSERFGITEFKITGRTHPTEAVLPVIQAYVQGDFQGNLLDLWPPVAKLGATLDQRETVYLDTKIIEESLDHFLWDCASNCGTCNYCERLCQMSRR